MKITRRQISKLLEAVLDDDDISDAISSEIELEDQITPERAAEVVAQRAAEMEVDVPENADTPEELEAAMAENPKLAQQTSFAITERLARSQVRQAFDQEIRKILQKIQ